MGGGSGDWDDAFSDVAGKGKLAPFDPRSLPKDQVIRSGYVRVPDPPPVPKDFPVVKRARGVPPEKRWSGGGKVGRRLPKRLGVNQLARARNTERIVFYCTLRELDGLDFLRDALRCSRTLLLNRGVRAMLYAEMWLAGVCPESYGLEVPDFMHRFYKEFAENPGRYADEVAEIARKEVERERAVQQAISSSRKR